MAKSGKNPPPPKTPLAFLASRECQILAPALAIFGLLIMFIKLANYVMGGNTHEFDIVILKALRTLDPSDPIGPMWLEIAMKDLTALGGHAVLVVMSLLAIGYLLMRRHTRSALLVALSGVGALGLNKALKLGFDRPRPDIVAHLTEVHSLSFPSGHAMLSAVIYLTLGALLARSQQELKHKAYILMCAMIIAGIIGLSRIYLGVHWPSDVLAGWCLGGAWAILCLKLATVWESSPVTKPAQG